MLVPSDLGQEDTYSAQFLSHGPRVQGWTTEAVASEYTMCEIVCTCWERVHSVHPIK